MMAPSALKSENRGVGSGRIVTFVNAREAGGMCALRLLKPEERPSSSSSGSVRREPSEDATKKRFNPFL